MGYREHNIAYYVEVSLEERGMSVLILLTVKAFVFFSYIRVEKVKG